MHSPEQLRHRASLALTEDDDHLVNPSSDELSWLAAQLACWPIRVHPDNTTNDRFLRMSAARLALHYGQILAERDALAQTLRDVRDFLRTAPMESGYCCCGDRTDAHNMGSGHTPVDELAYAASSQIDRINKVLND